MNSHAPQINPMKLLRIPEVLEMLTISRSKFWLMVKNGEFPKPIKIGRSSCWTMEQVRHYLDERIKESVARNEAPLSLQNMR